MAAAHRSLFALAVALARVVCGYDLDPCSSKPTFSKSSCSKDSVVACWSLDQAVPWACWDAEWAPAWSLIDGPAAADASCLSHRTPPLSKFSYYDGACTLTQPSLLESRNLPLRRQRPWADAKARAKETIAEMNETEKHMLMYGIGWHKSKYFFDLDKWWYVGNTAPIPRLGIPSLNMQDSGDGFRPYWNELVGTVTSWPSLLAVASTWDRTAVRALAVGISEEFVAKGANVLLGPSVNVHRVARNGRNFEYLSGEDPYLGAQLVVPYVEAVQSKGLIAVLKHWVFNEQETHRGEESSNVDAKTASELYYPPFEAAVNAGVDAVMCSYNKVNGVPSCSNQEQLDVLRDTWGFEGFVQSDWWAAHKTSISEGLDQDMPGEDKWFSLDDLEKSDSQEVDQAVERIVATMYRASLEETTVCSPPGCRPWLEANVTGRNHAMLARTLATESIILLQNGLDDEEEEVLPMKARAGTTIAVLGAAAVAKAFNPAGEGQGGADAWHTGDYYSGGGSGHITAGYVVTPLAGITARAAIAGAEVLSSTTDDVEEGLAVAAEAEYTIIVAAAACGESVDRANLTLDGGVDELIKAVAAKNKNVIVLLQVPGAVLMPWRNAVSAILCLFYGGQETGNAWASVLFGDHAPTGRLPIMMPQSEADAIPPNPAMQVPYTEGLKTSYRSDFAAAFPFGHGLTYTDFTYLPAFAKTCHGDDWCVTVPIMNSGERAGRTVAQLYLEITSEAGHPTPFLKGFQRTAMLESDEATKVVFHLTERDLSYYNADSASWVRSDWAIAHIGESFTDIRQDVSLGTPGVQSWLPGVMGPAIVVLLLLVVAGVFIFLKRHSLKRTFVRYESEESSDDQSGA